MRTTLKRGIGRGAAFDGNGSGNGRAVFPPAPAMRRFRMPPPPDRTTRQLLGWLFRWTLAAIVMVAVGVAGGVYLYGHQTLTAFAAHSAPIKKAQHLLSHDRVADPSQPAIALVVGYDKRAGADQDHSTLVGSLSDTVMLVRADPDRKTVSLFSFPRDLSVPIYCNNTVVATDRINSAWSRCQASGTVQTVEHLTGVIPNYLITVDFHGFKQLVNKLHGVYMDVDHRYINTQGGPYGYATINLEPGYQKLDGQQALDFVRFRHTDSDLYRLARQQLFVSALRDRIATGSIFNVFKIIGALKGNVEIAQGGGGAVPGDVALSYLKFAHGLPAGNLFRVTIDRSQISGDTVLTAPQSAIDEAVRSWLRPDVQAGEKAHVAALGLKVKKRAPQLKPGQITTLVLNGTRTVAGLARDTSYRLTLRGYRTLQLAGGQEANAPGQTVFADTTIYYDPAQANARQAAKQLQKQLNNSIVVPMQPEVAPYARSAGDPLTVVVLGSSFDGHLQDNQPPPDTTPKHEPASVISSPGTTYDAVLDAQRRLPFKALVPHVLERNSRLAALSPVRVYKPTYHRRGLRLTFVTDGGNVYWGIEETNWTDPPVLSHPSETRVIKGRTYDFYYTGSHLHLIALRLGDARYWVVNTLLDELSNETMIAIAKGLQPLSRH
jgi:LCP family protein required for cell wall assembly